VRKYKVGEEVKFGSTKNLKKGDYYVGLIEKIEGKEYIVSCLLDKDTKARISRKEILGHFRW